jgi:integrase
MLRKWMGHSSIETTAIYANAVGKEEMEIAGRMWAAP